MSKAAQGFLPACPAVSGEAYFSTSPRQIHAGQEGGNLRRTPLIGKIAIYGWKLVRFLRCASFCHEKVLSWQGDMALFVKTGSASRL